MASASTRRPATRKQAPRKKTNGPSVRGTGRKKRGSTKPRRWTQHVTETSDALDLERDVFVKGSARQIALSLKRSAEHSQRRKSSPYRSAMSMLTFYINRGGKNLSAARRRVLEQAKDELRDVFGRA
jgi:uncharacterized protein DUF3175